MSTTASCMFCGLIKPTEEMIIVPSCTHVPRVRGEYIQCCSQLRCKNGCVVECNNKHPIRLEQQNMQGDHTADLDVEIDCKCGDVVTVRMRVYNT